MYIIVAILVFGILIALHELGHFTAAKALGVRVNEFAIGMGPKILTKQGKETKYALRLLPIGGFCALEGEDGDSDDPRSFANKPLWVKIIILIAGSFMNFLAGFLIVLVLFSSSKGFMTPVLGGFLDGFPNEGPSGLMAGDRILSIDGEHAYTAKDVALYLSRSNGETVDLVIQRNGEKLVLDDFPLALREYQTDNGTEEKYGLMFKTVEASPGEVIKHTWYESIAFVRMVRMGLTDLLTGTVGIKQLSGPVGIVALINDVGESSTSAGDALWQVAFLCAFIAVNLAVMNLLPIPALDGGRIFFIIVTVVFEKLTRRKLNPRIEGYIHGTGLVLLLALMVYVMYNDIVKLI